MNYLYLLTITEILLLLCIVKFTSMDFTSPGFITVAMFLIASFCVIWNEKYWDVEFVWHTYYVVTASLILIVLVEFLIKNRLGKCRRIWIDQQVFIESASYNIAFGTKVIFLFLTTLFMLIYVITVVWIGGTNTSVLKAIGVVHNNSEINVGVLPTACARLSRLICFPCLFIFIYNLVKCKEKLQKNVWLLLPIFESFVTVFFSGVRSTFLYYFFAAFFYTVMLQRFKLNWKKVDLKKHIKLIIIFGIIFVTVFVESRSIVKNREYTSSGIDYVTFYLGSPLHLLNKIIDDTTLALPTYYNSLPGAHTFKWFYQELSKFGLVTTEIEATRFMHVGGGYYGGGNVYTIFLYPLHDFGFIGMLVYIVLFYAFFDYLYYKYFRFNRSIINSLTPLMIYGSYYYFVLMSFYVSMTAQIKLQTILEMVLTVTVFKLLIKLRIRFK